MKKRVINGLTTYFCRIYRCWLTKRGCESLQKRTQTAKKVFLSSNLPRTKAELGFILDPLIYDEACPCKHPVSNLESN